ncbi:TPA: DUF2802 domain-containing protein [Legionella pneumophila]|nr:DUF2802 domain-containing protein [Legionella pneumophila]HAU2264710.1 DUF2802 domain-containing protein [Legionella pneumophila]
MTHIFLYLHAIIFLLLGNYLLNQRKNINKLQSKIDSLEKLATQVVKDHPMLINADLLFAKQLNEINQQLISIETQLQELENIRHNDGSYQHALRILEMGGTREEIVSSCHLSNAEAELLMNLQAYRTALKHQN